MDDRSYKNLTESLQNVSEVTTRIDERVKMLVEDNMGFKSRFEKVSESQMELIHLNRLSIVENGHDVATLKNDVQILQEKVEYLSGRTIKIEQDLKLMEKNMGQHDNRWTNIVDFLYKVGTVVIGAIILWKLGLKP